MKKKLTLLFALLCVSVMSWAGSTPYCGETITAVDGTHTATFTCKQTGASTYMVIITSNDVNNITGYNAAPLWMHINGSETYQVGTHFSQDGNTVTATITSSSAPDFYTSDFYFYYPAEVHFILPIGDIDFTAACSGGDATPPTMTSATKASQTHNTVVINVVADDNVGVTKYVIKNHSDDSEVGEYTPAAGQITIEGLTPGTAYDWDVYAKDAAGNVSATGINISFTTDAAPSNIYCDYEIGHEANPSADVNSFILLSVGSDGNGHTIVNIKQDGAKNSAMFDYINIVGKKDIGADVTAGGSAEMAIVFPTPTPDGDGNIALDIQWSTINWGGRWQCHVELPADATCASADPFPGDNTYCSYTDNQLRANNANVALTWGTDGSGNVVVDITDGEGATNTAFRNGGFENEGSFAATWFVYSGTKHTTCEPATTYFNTGGTLSNENKRFTLTKKADLPANAVIAFLGHAFSWRTAQATGAYTLNKYFAYQYGYNCPLLTAPTNVAVDGSNVITFDPVANAETYTAKVYLDGILKHSQVVSSGDVLSFTPYTTATYQVQVVADAAGYPTSDPSTAYDWALTAPPIVLGNSEYCEYTIGSGTSEAQVNWETSVDGSIVISIQEVLGGAADATHFRGTGMNIDNFQVGEARTSASVYFNHTCGSSNQVTLTLKDANIKPGLGEKIYYTNKVVEWATSENNNAYSDLTFEYTYGTQCSGQKHVTVTVNNNEWGSATVNGGVSADVDPGTTVTCVATANPGYVFVNWTQGGVEVSTSLEYSTTITSNTALVANFEVARTAYCATPVTDVQESRTLYLTICRTENANEYKILFEGSANNKITGDNVYVGTTLTLRNVNGEATYTFNNGAGIWTVSSEGFGSAYVTFTATNYRDISFVSKGVDLFRDNSAGGSNLSSFNAFPDASLIKWDATCTDEEAPVLTAPTATPLSGTSVRLAVSATDDMAALLTYNVNYKPEGDAGAGTDLEFNGAAGEVTYKNIKGLSAGVRYQFSVTVSDGTNTSAAQVCYAKPSMPTAPVPAHNANLVRSIYSDKYESALAHDFQKDSWHGYDLTYVEVNMGGDHALVYDLVPYNQDAWFSWGAIDGANAIIAKDGYSDGEHDGLDASGMDYLHIDIMSANAAPYAEIQIMDVKLGDIPLTGSGWQSFDLPLATFKAAHADKIADINHMKFVGFRGPNNPEEIAIDNVYFWSYGTQTTPVMGGDAATGGWATFASPVKVAVPSGLTAYKATYSNEGGDEQLVLDAVSGAIPANEGVLLRGEPDHVYTFSPTNDAAGDYTGNALVGCPVRTDITSVAASNDIFCLRYSDIFQITGFYLYSGQYIAAGKAYLPLPKEAPSSAPRRLRFVINSSQSTTEIGNVDEDTVSASKFMENGQIYIQRGEAVYTIQGVRVK